MVIMTYRLNTRKIEVTTENKEPDLTNIQLDCGATILLPNELLTKGLDSPLSFYCSLSDSCKNNPDPQECRGVYELYRDKGRIVATCKFETKELYIGGILATPY